MTTTTTDPQADTKTNFAIKNYEISHDLFPQNKQFLI